MMIRKYLFVVALLWEATAMAYDPALITKDDLDVLRNFDKRYYAVRKSSAKRQSVGELIGWCYANMRYRSNAGAFDVNAYTDIQQETYYAPASAVRGIGFTYRPNDLSQIKVSKDNLGRTRIDALVNLSILDNSEAKREDEKTMKDKQSIASLVADIAALRSELSLLDVELEAHQLEEVRLKARSKSGVIAEDERLKHLSGSTDLFKQISKKEVEYEAKIAQLELYIQGDKLETLNKLIDEKL